MPSRRSESNIPYTTSFLCGGCQKRFISDTNRRKHCKARAVSSNCRTWYETVLKPSARASAHLKFPSLGRSNRSRPNHELDEQGIPLRIPSPPIFDHFYQHFGEYGSFSPNGAFNGVGDFPGEFNNDPGFLNDYFDPPEINPDIRCVDLNENEDGDNDGLQRNEYGHEGDDSDREGLLEALREFGLEGPQLNREEINDVLFMPREEISNAESRRTKSTFSKIHHSEYYPGAAKVFGAGSTFIDKFLLDKHEHVRESTGNIYYPLASEKEWEFTSVLMRTQCSIAEKNAILQTKLIRETGLSYKTAEAANLRIDHMPSGPQWSVQTITIPGFPTVDPILLYKRDAAECVEYLFNNPLFADHMNYIPVKHFTIDNKRVFSEPVSGQQAWNVQSKLPVGATRIGVGFASDATHLTNGTGDVEAHPLMVTIDNIDSSIRRKSSHHAYMLSALLPSKVKFLVSDKKVARGLRDQVYHISVRLVAEPLRVIAREGKYMSDPLGQLRYCYTVLSMFMVDYPEATKLAGVTGSASPVTTNISPNFGDPTPYPPRWWSITKAEIDKVKEIVAPSEDLAKFIKTAYEYRLTGAYELIWDGWDHAEPPNALCFDMLHSGHKFWNDHILLWCTEIIGEDEVDLRYKCLQPRKGFKYFHKGVAKLKRSSCRDYRDMQRSIVAVIDGAAPSSIITLVSKQLEYLYQAQKPEITESDLLFIEEQIQEVHKRKHLVNTYSKGKRSFGFNIPKLGLQHQIIHSTIMLGSLLGLSTETAEHEHINMVKVPYRRSNRKEFEKQVCSYLTRMERLRHFDLATSLLNLKDFSVLNPELFYGEDENEEAEFLSSLSTVQTLRGAKRADFVNYFSLVKELEHSTRPLKEKRRIRTFAPTSFTAIHLNRDPRIARITIDQAALLFKLPDLRDAIHYYYYSESNLSHTSCSLGSRRQPFPRPPPPLPFNEVKVWFTIKTQTKSLLHFDQVTKPITICAEPSSSLYETLVSSDTTGALSSDAPRNLGTKGKWTHGRYDSALFINDMNKPFSGKANLKDHTLGQIRLIFQPITGNASSTTPYFVYAQRFDPVRTSALPNMDTGLIRLRRALHNTSNTDSNSDRIGSVMNCEQIRTAVDVIPFFSEKLDRRLNCLNAMDVCSQFNLNKFSDKELFELLH